MVACADTCNAAAARIADSINAGFSPCSIYLLYILDIMITEKITIKKTKKRTPVPKKPPKIEDAKKTYNRKKEKVKITKIISGDK